MSNSLPYRIEVENRRAIVALLPELNEVPWADIEKVGSEILSRIQPLNSPQLLVDLCALNYMGSAQVALVVRMFKLIKEKSGKMVVANRDPMVLEVLSLAGLNKVWTIVESRDKALSMLGGSMMSGSGGGSSSEASNPWPLNLSIVAVVIAAVFLVIHLANPALIPSRGDLFGMLGGSVAALLLGLWAMSSGSRVVGIGVTLVSVGMLLYGVFEVARPQAASTAPAETSEDADEEGKSKKKNSRKVKSKKTDPEIKTDNTPAPPAGPPGDPAGVKPGTVDPAQPPEARPADPQATPETKDATPPTDPKAAEPPK